MICLGIIDLFFHYDIRRGTYFKHFLKSVLLHTNYLCAWQFFDWNLKSTIIWCWLSLQKNYGKDLHDVQLNHTHMEELVFYWKNSLKYKVCCFWRFQKQPTLYFNELSSFSSIIVQMSEKLDSSSIYLKWMDASFSNFYGKTSVGFYFNIRKRFFLEFLFFSQQKDHRFF